jgi:hypothetical protein
VASDLVDRRRARLRLLIRDLPNRGRRAFGGIEPLEYVMSVDGLDGSRAAPPGSLHAAAVELHEMTKVTKELNEIIRSASLEPA